MEGWTAIAIGSCYIFFHTQFCLSSFVFRLFFANSIFVKCTLTALPIVVNRIWLQKCQPLQIQSHLSTEVAALLQDSGRLNSQQILLSIPRGKFNISSQSHKLKSWNISLKQQCRNFPLLAEILKTLWGKRSAYQNNILLKEIQDSIQYVVTAEIIF